MSDESLSSVKRQSSTLLTRDDRRDQEARLNEIIRPLWETSLLREVRQSPPFQEAHQKLLDLINNAAPETVAIWYGQQILGICDADGIELSVASVPGVLRIPAPVLTKNERQVMYAIVSGILDSAAANLFDAQHPRDNWHYRVLVAHLLSWPKEMHKASELVEPFPWPFFIQEDKGSRPFARGQVAATQRQERIVNKLNGILRTPNREAKRMPYGSLSKQTKPANNTKTAHPKTAPMHEKRLRVAKVAYNLLQADQTRTLSDVRENQSFRDAQMIEFDKIRVEADSTLSEWLTEYRKVTGCKLSPRRRDK